LRAFVTGGTGFLGAHLVRHLLGEGDDVAVLIRPDCNGWRMADVRNDVTTIVGDIDAAPDIGDRLLAWSPDVVYHLAWEGIHGNDRNSIGPVRRNVSGALDLLEVAAAARCHTWIGLGSQAEFGPTTDPLSESSTLRPVSAYGASKLAAGQLTGNLCRALGIKHTWLRLLSAYGPMDQPTYLIPYVIGELLAHRRPALSEGSQPHNTLHADDVASALRQAAVSPGCAGTFVLCAGEAPTVRELAISIRDIAAPGAPLGFGERGVVSAGHSGSANAFRAATTWDTAVNLEDGLRETVDWYRGAAVGTSA